MVKRFGNAVAGLEGRGIFGLHWKVNYVNQSQGTSLVNTYRNTGLRTLIVDIGV